MEESEVDPAMKISVDRIKVPEVRVSAQFTPEQLAHFKASVGELGVIQDPTVRDLGDGTYELIAGRSRFLEQRERGAREIEAKVIQADEKSSIVMNITENLARGTYDPMEVSKQLHNFLDHGGSTEDLVRMTGHTRDWVSLYLNLTELPGVYQQALSRGDLRVGHIQQALKIDDPQEIDAALNSALNLKWPVSVIEKYIIRRGAELEEARRKRESPVPPKPPTPTEAAEKVRYSTCGICTRSVESRFIAVPGTCQDCLEFTRYATQLLGTGREAMQRLYDAVSHYQQFLQMQREMVKQMRPSPPEGQTETPPQEQKSQT